MGRRRHRLIGGPQLSNVVYEMVLFLEFSFFSLLLVGGWTDCGRDGGVTLHLKVRLQMLDLFLLLPEATSGLCSIAPSI